MSRTGQTSIQLNGGISVNIKKNKINTDWNMNHYIYGGKHDHHSVIIIEYKMKTIY